MPVQTRPGRHRQRTAALAPPVTITRGSSSWLNHNVNTAAAFTNHGTSIVGAWMDWADFEPTPGVFNYGVLDDANNGFNDAHDNGYKILWRLSCGEDAPIGMPGTSQPDWLSSVLGCARVRLVGNQDDNEIYVPVMWDPILRARYNLAQTEFARFLNEPCPRDASHKRKLHCAGVMATMPTEQGTEMALGYGTPPTYIGAATLGTAMNATTPGPGGTIELLGSLTGYPTNQHILKIGLNERLLCSGRVGTTVTIQARQWTGSTVTFHSVGDAVKYANPNGTLGTPSAPFTFNGVPGIYDHRLLNRAQWEAILPESTRQVNVRDSWTTCVSDLMSIMPAELPILIAIAVIFEDNYVGEGIVVNTLGSAYGSRFWVGCTDIRATPVRNVQGDPMPTYQATRPVNHTVFLNALSLGCRIWAQTSGTSTVGAHQGQEIVDAVEDFIIKYEPTFIETNMNTRFTSTLYTTWAAYGWPGRSNLNTKGYFVTDPSSVQARMLAATT